jgi:hypothetical protein
LIVGIEKLGFAMGVSFPHPYKKAPIVIRLIVKIMSAIVFFIDPLSRIKG